MLIRWLVLCLCWVVMGSLSVPRTWGQTPAQLVNGNRTHAGATNYGITTGATNAYVLTLNKPIPAYADGSCYLLELHAANTGPATLNVNGKGAKSIFKFVSGVSTPLAADDFGVGQVVEVCYDGVNMQAQLGGGGGAGGPGDIGAVGSCTSADCFTTASPSPFLVFNNATSGTVRLEAVPGALGNNVARLKAETGNICTDASVCATYQPFFNQLTNDAQLKRAANDFTAFAQKAVPVSADKLLIEDSAAAGAKKYVEISALPTGAGGTGDVQAVGTCASGDCFTSGNPSAALFIQEAAAPGAPAGGRGVVYYDATTFNLAVKTATNVIKHGVQTTPLVLNQFVRAIAADGLVTQEQPAFGNLSGSLLCTQHPALAGDVQSTPGSCTTAVANLPSGVPAAGSVVFTAMTAPAAPTAGKGAVYVDTTTQNLTMKPATGPVRHGVQTTPLLTNQFLSAIGADGAVTQAQPAFGNLSGSLLCIQHPALTGDVQSTPGTCNTVLAQIPTAIPAAGSILFTAIAPPANPTGGIGTVYVNSTTTNLVVRNNAGVEKHGVQTTTALANQFVTGVQADGQLTRSPVDLAGITGAGNVLTNTSTHVVEGKQMVARESTLTIVGINVAVNTDLADIYILEAIGVNPTFLTPTGSGGNPRCNQDITFRLSTTTERTVTWSAAYVAVGIPLPTVLRALPLRNHIKFRYNCVATAWELLSVNQKTGSETGYANLPLTGIKMHPNFPTGPIVANPTTVIWFDDTTQECILWEWTIPGDYLGSPVLRLWYAMLSDTNSAHSATFDVQVWALTAGQDVQTPSFGGVNNCDDTNIPATAGIWNDIGCALTNNDGAVANDPVQFQICSDVAGTWTGDLGLIRARFEYAK